MALFGFNKAKVLASAEKFVQQGKLQNAIAEYEKVVKEDPKDLTVLNTIGDLCARVGKNDHALNYFRRVGDTYANEGFTVKAIAMYKKLTKLNPSDSECVTKLAELYTKQGLYNDARAQYMTIADQLLKGGNNEDAARIFQKMLELDPENAGMQTKLADLYIKLHKNKEAQAIYINAAQSLYARSNLDAAEEALAKVAKLDPGNVDAIMLRAQIAMDQGHPQAAAELLSHLKDLDSRPEALRTMLGAFIQAGDLAAAGPVAEKLLTVHNDITGTANLAQHLLTTGQAAEALRIYDRHADRFLSQNSGALLETLRGSVTRIKDDPQALELLLGIYRKAGDAAASTEAMELLAHAYTSAGDLPKARDLYRELVQLEPEDPQHAQHYKQVIARLGEDSAVTPLPPSIGEQALMVDELEHTSPALRQAYPRDVEQALAGALTDSELYSSYNVPAKSIAPLETVLPKAPMDARLNQRLASLYARDNRFADAARCCLILGHIYESAGHPEDARKYRAMAERYAERGGVAVPELPDYASQMPPLITGDEPPAVAPFSLNISVPQDAAAVAAPPPPHPPVADEWEAMLDEDHPVPPPSAPGTTQFIHMDQAATETPAAAGSDAAADSSLNDLIDEVRFYISQGMWTEAASAVTSARLLAPNHPAIAEFDAQIKQAQSPAAGSSFEMPVEPPPMAAYEFGIGGDAPLATTPDFGTSTGTGGVAAFTFDSSAAAPAGTPPPSPVPDFAASPSEMDTEPEPVTASAPAPAPSEPKDILGDFALDLEESLGSDFAIAPPAASKSSAPAASRPSKPATAPMPPPQGVPAPSAAPLMSAADTAPAPSAVETKSVLTDMFDEFKEDVEDSTAQAEDPDTHYNLAVAFREMGLLDEAIGELQKVAQSIEHGTPFSQAIQAYTWLAQCFVDKGIPGAALRWYEKALTLPNLDEDSKLAIRYDLGSACELAGDKAAARRNFDEVVSVNIDYRDAQARARALKG